MHIGMRILPLYKPSISFSGLNFEPINPVQFLRPLEDDVFKLTVEKITANISNVLPSPTDIDWDDFDFNIDNIDFDADKFFGIDDSDDDKKQEDKQKN